MRIRCQIMGIEVALFLLVLPLMALATTMIHRTLPEMVGQAERVFVGVCTSVKDGALAEPGVPYTEYRFKVKETLKGNVGGQITIRQFGVRRPRVVKGSDKAQVAKIPGMPHYQEGQEVLLFLTGDSSIGLTSPIGLYQGAFLIREEDGEKMAVNGFNNLGLFRGLAPESFSESVSLSPQERGLLAIKKGPVNANLLLSIIKKLGP